MYLVVNLNTGETVEKWRSLDKALKRAQVLEQAHDWFDHRKFGVEQG